MDWKEKVIAYLHEERNRKLEHIETFDSGRCQLFQRGENITEERIEALRSELAEVETILLEEGRGL